MDPVTDMIDDSMIINVISLVISSYINVTLGRELREDSFKGMVKLINPTAMDNMIKVAKMIMDLCRDPDGLVSFFDDDLAS